MDKAQYPHQDLAQHIADYWASPDEANQMLAFAFLKSQTLGWAEKDCKELINTALCLCWDKPELLEFLDFDKRKNAVISYFDKAVNDKKTAITATTLILNSLYMSANTPNAPRVHIGFWGFEGLFISRNIKKTNTVAKKITATLTTKCIIDNDFSQIYAIIAEFKELLPEVLVKENTSVNVTVYSTIKGLDIDHYFNSICAPDLADWNKPEMFAPRLTEYVYNNLNKLTE